MLKNLKKKRPAKKAFPDFLDSQRLALLIPAHNEELVLEPTIKGAQAAGIPLSDVYVVDDSSSDNTYVLAVTLLDANNVLYVERSGKAGALIKAIEFFELKDRYDWIQVLDADSIFSPDYFTQIRKYFKPGIAAVCGQVKSLRNNWITSFRAYEYTIGHDFYKSIQNLFNVIPIMPGPATCLSTSILDKIDFATDTLTEDFDITLQIHHKKLGRIIYAPHAHSFTQDPPNLKTFTKQIDRWNTGFFQVMKKHRVGTKLRAVDVVLLLLTFEAMAFVVQLLLLAVLSVLRFKQVDMLFMISSDILIMTILVTYAAIRNKRLDIILPLPLYYLLRVLNLYLYTKAAIKVLLLPKRKGTLTWNTGRVVQSNLAVSGLKGGD